MFQSERKPGYFMGKCLLCGKTSNTISNVIGVCANCLRKRPREALKIAMRSHIEWRIKHGLPPIPPKTSNGVKCSLCVNECIIPVGGRGYCGVIVNDNGILRNIAGPGKAVVFWYLDPHPTNCVAEPVCPATTSRGYPKYTRVKGVEYGYYNLAVFFGGCNLDCLFCQNWEHREMPYKLNENHIHSLNELVEAAMNPRVTCVCYFGGDPGPHITFALAASRIIARKAREEDIIKRICWETNGLENPLIMREMAKISLETGGIVKIDFKAWSPSIYQALTGINGVERVKENIRLVASLMDKRPEPPLLVVSTLLVPGYVDLYEVRKIAEFLAKINPKIPYVLLGFHPDHRLTDLPRTSRDHMFKAYNIARETGLREVFMGNLFLLGDAYRV